jgi:P4 family phage/plasmid primase-like protien
MAATPPDPNAPQGNVPAALAFLERWRPGGPWVLTAISVDRKSIETQTFDRASADELAHWLEHYVGGRNLYFHVNPCTRPLTKKAEREDVAALAWLHVDIDPRAGEDLAQERDRALRLLREPPSGVPRPTVIIFSGGGYQGFWKLREPLPIEGDLARAEDAKRYNLQLEVLFGADNCHNVDRIMRLPGSINLPDAKKQRKGRTPTLAELVEFDEERVYDLAQFTPAPAVQSGAGTGISEQSNLRVSGNIPRLGSVEELNEWSVPDRVKVIIVQGRHPDEGPKPGDDSRSAWLFDVVCNLVRAGVPNDVIYSVLTDPDFGISESVREKGNRAERYALRQIEKARAEVVSDAPAEEQARGNADKPPILSKNTPYKSAAEFLFRERPHLKHFNDDWLTYDGAAYAELEDATVRAEIYAFLERARVRVKDEAGNWTLAPFNPNTSKVSQVIDALEARAHVPRDLYAPPCWLEGAGPPPREIVACRNGLLHLPTGELLDATPRFFTRNALGFAHDPDAVETSEWLGFLRSLWPREPDTLETLQEVFGYLLTPDTSLQKAFLLLGPPRSGKGTIGRVLTELVGPQNSCAPTLLSLAESFGLQPLIGRQLALVSDLRLGPKTDRAAIAENLLRITGEDLITANRKYKREWTGRLATRFLIMTNEVPRFADASGALANRFVPLVMTESYLGREDPGLIDRLLPELPGILNWAIAGWRRLRARGYFLLPAASRELVQQLADAASPVAAFVRDECVVEPEGEVEKDELFRVWRLWCERNGRHPGTSDTLGRELMAALGGKVRATRRRAAGRRVPIYAGLRLVEEAAPF